VSPAKSGATGTRRPGKTRLNRGQSKASAQFGVGRRGEKLKPEDRGQRTEDRGQRTEDRGQRTEVRARRGSTEYTADGKGGPGTGKPDRPKHTICRGRPYPKNTRYSGFQGLFCVSCLSLQRLGLSVGFGTGTRMAPKKKLRTLRVTWRERAALLRPRVPRRAGTNTGHPDVGPLPPSREGKSGSEQSFCTIRRGEA
jgi:hypothetical protein